MVKKMDRAGLRDWIVQRVTALLIGVYTLFLFAYFLSNPSLTYATWRGLFDSLWMRLATLLVLVSVLWHAWIGLWTVFTDYVKPKCVRLLLQALVILLMLVYFIWVFFILWR